MRITLIGSRHFGVTILNMLREHGVDVARVVVHDGEDRLALAARAAGVELVVQRDRGLVTPSEIAPGTDLIITAHSHARVTNEALAASRLGGIGYHPSLLPRHLYCPGTAGQVAAQEWCFVKNGETARELWERALAPLGIKLLAQVIDYAKLHNALPAIPQDEQFATLAPKLPH
jgi:methionyl-tRNA formyltransferase